MTSWQERNNEECKGKKGEEEKDEKVKKFQVKHKHFHTQEIYIYIHIYIYIYIFGQVEAPCVSSHTEKLWYNETVCLWITVYIYIYIYIYIRKKIFYKLRRVEKQNF